jgi:hypothetical protein
LPTVCFANNMGRSCWQSRRAVDGVKPCSSSPQGYR